MRNLSLAVLVTGLVFAAPAAAEVSVAKTQTGVSVTATEAPLSDVLGKLSEESGSAIALSGGEDVVVDGTFEGPLETVLNEILKNTSFLLSGSRSAGMDVQVITGTAPPASVAGVMPPGIIEQPPVSVIPPDVVTP
jgi:hypothetical protein